MSDEGLRILELRAENVKRLKAVRIEPDPQGGLVIIGGENAQGKTSVLDSILWALGGERAIPPVPIREGETKAEITVDLGAPDGVVKYRVTRSITPKGSYLKLDMPGEAGLQAKSPQKMLDGLLGTLTFDPLAFTRMKPADQRAALLDATGLGERVAEIDSRRKEAFDERTMAGRDLRAAEGHLKSMPEPVGDIVKERVDVASLAKELNRVMLHKQDWDRTQDACAQAQNSLDEARATLKVMGEPEDATPIREALARAQDVDKAIDAVQRYELAGEVVGNIQTHIGKLNNSLLTCDEEKLSLMRGADLPLEGLGCNEDGVTFEDLPLEQAASSVRLRVSAAIGMALNQKLKIMRIEDGSLLDGENLTTLAEMARGEGFQIWIERVGGDDPGAVIIEDGSVVED